MPENSSPTREPHPVTAYRARHNLSMGQLARRAKMSAPGLWRIEAGDIEMPTVAVVRKLVLACEGEVSEIDIFRYHLAVATGLVAPMRAPATEKYNWNWVRPRAGTEPVPATA